MEDEDYIKIISSMSDHYGGLLIQLMDRYNATNLQEISNDQAKEFYEELKQN